MKTLLKIISFFIPITRKVSSAYNGFLELRLVDGRLLLDSARANYSYGSLQRVMEFSLQQIPLTNTKSVLLLGLGGGSVIKILRHLRYEGLIVAVDIDPVIIRIASEEFGVTSDPTTEIQCIDAIEYVSTDPRSFDLIIIDLFVDDRVPEEILAKHFWNSIKERVAPHGYIIFNLMNESQQTIDSIKGDLSNWGFLIIQHDCVERYNTVLIAKHCIGSWLE